MTPQHLTMMSRQLPSTVRKAFGHRETQPDPGLIAYQRWPRAAQLRRMIHCMHAVYWRSNRLGLVFSVHLLGAACASCLTSRERSVRTGPVISNGLPASELERSNSASLQPTSMLRSGCSKISLGGTRATTALPSHGK